MSSKGYVETLLNGLEPDQRKLFALALREIMDHAELGGNTKATNFNWYMVNSTTHATAGTEFSFRHGLDHAPKWLLPVVDLQTKNSQLVGLGVSRVADTDRVYLTSASTSVVFTAFLE